MFGYVKPFKPELRICEYEVYKAVYCGLCGQLGKSFGPAARLTLSYDFTFLSMLHFAVSESDPPAIAQGRCYVNPMKKVPVCGGGEALRFSADTAAIMLYYKLLDNLCDEGLFVRLGCRIVRPWAASAHRKASAVRPECETAIAGAMSRQRELEKNRTPSVDAASEPTATAMAEICRLLSGDKRQQRILEQLGYFVGRYVYLCDALDDLEEDVGQGKYNSFALRHNLTKDAADDQRDRVYNEARASLYATIAEAAKAFELLELRMFQPILGNVFYRGMRASVDQILAKKEKIR